MKLQLCNIIWHTTCQSDQSFKRVSFNEFDECDTIHTNAHDSHNDEMIKWQVELFVHPQRFH